MRHVAALCVFTVVVLACGGGGGATGGGGGGFVPMPAARKTYVEGTDYVVLERVRVPDTYGFAQPMEAYSILVPRGWQGQGGITWKVGNPCMVEAVSNRVTLGSNDGAWRLDILPAQQWDWWDDTMMLQTQMQQAQNPVFRRCPIAQPMDAAQLLRGPMAQEIAAQVVDVQPSEELVQALRREAQVANQRFQQAGVPIEHRPSAAIATLRYPDGSPGVALASLQMMVSWMPNYMTGGQSASYSCTTITKIALKFPAGKEQEGRQLLGTVMGSFRVNPEWQQGVQQVVNNVRTVERREEGKRAQIQMDALRHSQDLQQRTWEQGQASRDRIAESWGQTLRGVETWNDPSGTSIELSAGYNEAWSRPDGTYILSNDPLFDPTVVFQEDWKRLQKSP